MNTIKFPNEKPRVHGACHCGNDLFHLILDKEGGRVIAI